MISETGRAMRWRGGLDCGGAGAEIPDDRRRRNLFAFSRGPASFLSMEPRRLCLGNCSSTAFRLERRVDVDRVRRRLEIDKGSGETSPDCKETSEL